MAALGMIAAFGPFGAPAMAQETSRFLDYRCGDLAVIARVENLDSEPVADPDDLMGHGWITLRVRVDEVLGGRPPALTLRAKIFAHTYLNERRLFRLVLAPQRDGSFTVRDLSLADDTSGRSLPSRCARHD